MGNRKQHVVPNFYLKEFFPGIVYRKGEKSPRFTKKARNLSVRTNYYGKPGDDLILPLDELNSVIESQAAPVLKRLILGETTTINRSDWVTLSYFFANMQLRNPSYHETLRRSFRQMTDQINEMVEKMKASYEKAKAEGKEFHIPLKPDSSGQRGYSLEEVNKSMEELEAKDGNIKITENLFYHMRDIAAYIQKMSLHVLTASALGFFITTDTPLVLFSLSSGSPVGAGWGNNDALAVIPVHPKHCMVLCYRKERTIYTKVLARGEVEFWNIEMMKYASREIYSKHPYNLALDWMHDRGIWQREK